LTTTRFTK